MGDRSFTARKRGKGKKPRALQSRFIGYLGNAPIRVVFCPVGALLYAQLRIVWGDREAATFVVDLAWWIGMSDLERSSVMANWIKKAQNDDGCDLATFAATDVEVQRDYEALYEYMTLRVGPDGGHRKTASLTVFAEDGMWKGCVNDRQEGLTLWASADTLAGLLDALDGFLRAPNTPWRKPKDTGRGKRG